MNQRQAQFNAMVKPNDPSGPPSSATVSIGTGYGLYNDFLQDSNESTQPGVKDNYLILENPAGDTCGPIATHNCLTHFGSALNFTQLEPLIGYVKGSGVGWSSKIASGLNSQESTYYYTAFTYMGSSQSAWDSTMTDLAIATGREGVPTDVNTNGYLHQFGHNLGHFWVGCGYNNYYGTDSARYINYNDTSQEHSGTYWFSQPVSWFIGVCNIYGINA